MRKLMNCYFGCDQPECVSMVENLDRDAYYSLLSKMSFELQMFSRDFRQRGEVGDKAIDFYYSVSEIQGFIVSHACRVDEKAPGYSRSSAVDIILSAIADIGLESSQLLKRISKQ